MIFSSISKLLHICHPRKLFIMLLCLGLMLYLYATYATDQIDKEFASVIENDTLTVCKENFSDKRQFVYVPQDPVSNIVTSTTQTSSHVEKLPKIYFVTPTYPRREQMAELTRLGQTLMHVQNIVWIVADDSESCNPRLDTLLSNLGLPYIHLSSPMPFMYKSHKSIPRGVSNRRAALSWIKSNKITDGVLYFGDDDNTFDLRLFSEIRHTQKVSMFPVGLIGDYSISSPIIKNNKVVAFFDSWPAKRTWPVDMAGFAVNLGYLAKYPNATMPYKAGYEEDAFLKSIGLKINEIEPLALGCTEVYVWHTQTTKTKAPLIKVAKDTLKNSKSNLMLLLTTLSEMGVNHFSGSGGVKAIVSRDGKSKSLISWAH
ncbi:CLUMA_CG011911, isoform A [Clunio marinus]|uniref:Galactosylgalactosylxylosylprotein 3-beta-glucuronosyltransferase n=1 Tax=Clunio marinus TaxID=568069 RepID=A0A1J1IG96_9DIPT|nr:CLUMA_CG011911, isoform A [Clunio marinus]